ncbi:MAG: hypothetical protein IKI97_01925 [Clostridia bacterium]|nr:hypothetical protein [Clostridia bacterium]
MYSRNLTFDNSTSGVRLTPGNQHRQSPHQEKVPVRSFTDGFAYDRFNRMGEPMKQNSPQGYSGQFTEEPANTDDKEYVQPEQVQNADSETNINTNEIIANQEKKDSEISLLSKVKLLFDSDTILIILAVIMILFSDNATNDKLTPFALLAILFL